MRRLLPSLLVLTPLLLALLYVLIYHLAAPDPTVATVVPERAIYVQRYRDLDALDRTFFRHPDDAGSPAERISRSLNIAGFPGLDRRRPIHLVFLPRGAVPDTSMFILPLVNEDALRARFEDPRFFLERSQVRYAKYLGIRGDFAAIGRDPDGVEHLGEGGLTGAELGETFLIAVDVPGVVDYAAQAPWEAPWSGIFAALGVGPDDIRMDDGVPSLASDRVARVRASWKTARLWAFMEEKRIRVELTPAEGPLADALTAVARGGPARAEGSAPPPPHRAQAWIRLSGAAERALFALALHAAGLRLPDGLEEDGPGDWGRADLGAGLLLWGSAAPGAGYAWTLGVAAPPGTLLDLAPFLPEGPPLRGPDGTLEADRAVPQGVLTLTVADLTLDREAPAGRIQAFGTPQADVVLIGPAVDEARADFERGLAEGAAAVAAAPPEAPWHEVLRFGLEAARARTLLASELLSGGLLAALAGGDIEGEVTTDGRVLRLEARVVERSR